MSLGWGVVSRVCPSIHADTRSPSPQGWKVPCTHLFPQRPGGHCPQGAGHRVRGLCAQDLSFHRGGEAQGDATTLRGHEFKTVCSLQISKSRVSPSISGGEVLLVVLNGKINSCLFSETLWVHVGMRHDYLWSDLMTCGV